MNKKATLKLGSYQIRTTYDYEGKIRINLGDLCEILKRDDLMRNGDALKMCPSSLKIVFRKNGKEAWSIKPADVRRLLSAVRKETNLPHEFIREVESWANRLIESERPVAVHKSEPVTFYYEKDFPVTFQSSGDRIMVNTTQITMHYGKLPSEWLRIASTDTLRRDMEKAGTAGPYESQIFTTRGRGRGATWLESRLAIALARWVAPKTGLADWCEQQIADMEHVDSRVSRPRYPAARPVPEAPAYRREPLPDNLEDALKLIDRLQTIIEENSPKVEFYEEFIENRDWFKSTRIADELKISPHQLHQFLFEEGICKYENKRWVVYNAYRAWQCDVPYTWTNSFGKAYTFGSTKRWTQAGREYIIELWNQKHPESQV